MSVCQSYSRSSGTERLFTWVAGAAECGGKTSAEPCLIQSRQLLRTPVARDWCPLPCGMLCVRVTAERSTAIVLLYGPKDERRTVAAGRGYVV